MKLLLTVFILSFSLESFATNFGSFSCGEIVQYERDNNKIQMDAISMWFSGYIDGRDFRASGKHLNTFPSADAQTIYLLLIKECRENPTIKSIQAADRIYERGN